MIEIKTFSRKTIDIILRMKVNYISKGHELKQPEHESALHKDIDLICINKQCSKNTTYNNYMVVLTWFYEI